MRVGGYCRISYGDDDRLGVGRQQADNEAMIRLRGWEVGPSYVDQNISAYSGVVRPAFEQMLNDLEAGVIQGIVVWDLDRLARQPTDLERIIKIYDQIPGLVFATVQGDLQLATSDGRTLARVMCAFASKASMDTSRRVARKKLEKALNGDSTSNYRAYGWNDDGTLQPEESAILQQAITDVLEHKLGLYVICDRLNAQGYRTVRGHTWKTSAMRRVLTAPRLAGFAIYRGEILMGEDGAPVRGQWEPLVDEQTWRALDARLRPRKGAYPERKKKYLLSGIARCGLCGTGLVGYTRHQNKHGYMCRSKDSGGCAKVGISGQLDEVVVELLLTYLDDIEVKEISQETFPGQQRLGEIGSMMAELIDQYQSGLSGSIVFPLLKKLEDEQRELSANSVKYIRTVHPNSSVRQEWPSMSLPHRQAIIRRVIEAIVIRPAGRTGHFDPSRASVIWKNESLPESGHAVPA